MNEEQVRLRGWSVPIFKAVQAAGGPVAVAAAMGFKASTTPMHWYKSGSIRKQYIHGLCALGGNTVTPDEIIADIEARHVGEAA